MYRSATGDWEKEHWPGVILVLKARDDLDLCGPILPSKFSLGMNYLVGQQRPSCIGYRIWVTRDLQDEELSHHVMHRNHLHRGGGWKSSRNFPIIGANLIECSPCGKPGLSTLPGLVHLILTAAP